MYGENWIKLHKLDDVVEFNKALSSYLYFKKDSLDIINVILANNPNFIMANCFKGFLILLSRDKNKGSELDKIFDIIKLNTLKINDKLLIYINILKKWNSGEIYLVQKELLNILRGDPKDILALRLYHFNQIFIGLDENYLNNHLQILKKWNEKDEFYPLVLGMVSYALEESNNYIDAEFYARKSLDISDKDLWSIHALCHLHDSNQHNSDGIHVLNDKKIEWSIYGPMKRHLWWHKSLFFYYESKFKECLILYDNYINNDDFFYLDFCNSASLLIRLKLKGVDIGNRLDQLKKSADYFLHQNTLPFIDFHLILFYFNLENNNSNYFLSKEFENKYINSDYINSYNKSLKPLINILDKNKIDNINIISDNFIGLGGSFAQREVILLQLLNINDDLENNYNKIIKDNIIKKKNIINNDYI